MSLALTPRQDYVTDNKMQIIANFIQNFANQNMTVIYNILHTLFTVQSGAVVLDLVQPDGGDSMVTPGPLHLPHLLPVLPSPLVYFISAIVTVIPTSRM